MSIAGFVLGGGACATAFGQAPPNAGSLLNEVRPPAVVPHGDSNALPSTQAPAPALAGPDDIRVDVSAITVTGASAIDVGRLQALVADLVGPQRTLADLQQGAQRISLFYRQQGYLLARAYLPAQDIRDGRVEIHVMEGQLGNITLDNQARISDERIRQHLEEVQVGAPLQAAQLESSLLRLGDTPGLVVRSALKPGAAVGSSDLDIHVSNGPVVSGIASVDNYGNRYTGAYRVGGGLVVANPLGLGDALQIDGVTAGGDFNYARLAWQLPLGASANRLGLAYGKMRYRLGKDFSLLGAHGDADVATAYLARNLVRSRAFNLNLQVSVDNKRLRDDVDLIGSSGSKVLNNLTLALSGDLRDGVAGGGASQGSLSLTHGHLGMDAAAQARDALAYRTAGDFTKVNAQLSRLQQLPTTWSLYANLGLQVAAGNLDSAEKMDLGGVYGVRAYPQGEAPADSAWLVNTELRYGLGDQWQLLALFDAAQGRLAHSPLVGDVGNRRTLSGYGVGARWSHPDGYSLNATAAWRSSGAPTSDHDRTPRLAVQLARRF